MEGEVGSTREGRQFHAWPLPGYTRSAIHGGIVGTKIAYRCAWRLDSTQPNKTCCGYCMLEGVVRVV